MIYSICGLNIDINPKYELLKSRAEKYIYAKNCNNPNFSVTYTDDDIISYQNQSNNCSKEAAEYSLAGVELFKKIIDFNGFVLHSSAIKYNGYAYIFSAPSGTGKSTHTKLWCSHFKNSVTYINDDKPIIRFIDDKFYVCGNPFSGKYDLNNNIIVPLKGICFLEQSPQNLIFKMPKNEALFSILSQTLTFRDQTSAEKLLNILDKLLQIIPVFKLKCNISDEAVITAFNGINEINI